MNTFRPTLDRRGFLRAAGVGALGLAGIGALAACGPGGSADDELAEVRYALIGDGKAEPGTVLSHKLGGLDVSGVDMITWDEDGQIVDFTVMVRPRKALDAVIEHMGAELMRMLEASGA